MKPERDISGPGLVELRGAPTGDRVIRCPHPSERPGKDQCGRFLMKAVLVPGLDLETVCHTCGRKVWIRVLS
jgi:hypothetical protein